MAIEQGLGEYFLTRALEHAGKKTSDVQVVYLPYAAAEEALAQRRSRGGPFVRPNPAEN